jgi:betaine-aldehyde dehydrogenase
MTAQLDRNVDRPVARHWIAGAWSSSGEQLTSISPSDGSTVGHFVSAGRAEAQAAVDAARAAFDSGEWSSNAVLRSDALLEFAGRLQERFLDVASMLSREGGKRLPETMWEVGGSIAWLKYAAATALTQNAGRAAEVSPGVYFQSNPEPVGVAGVITPWNSPIILGVRAIGPALAAGCTVVLKMPGQTALTNALFAEAAAATTSLPAGVLNIFTEAGNEGAPLLVESPLVDVVSYTGSTDVGRAIAAAGAPTLKRLNLELGGKTPLILLDDADLDAALPQVVRAMVTMNGQFCVTGSRVLVHRSIAEEVRARLTEMVSSIRIGRSDDPASELGPLVDKASVARLDEIVRGASAAGRVLVEGGPVTDGPLADGAFYRPSLVEIDDLDSPLVQAEVFGPVQTFEVFDNDDDAVRRANATQYGLAASIFSRDPLRARTVGRRIAAAGIWVNTWALLSEHFEQGGFKASGYGYLCGPRAIEEFQILKIYSEMTPAAAMAAAGAAAG